VILLVDMGNSRVKWRLCQNGQPIQQGEQRYDTGWQWLAPLAALRPEAVWVSCVAATRRRQAFSDQCARLDLPLPVFASSGAEFGRLRNGYRDPAQLGVDRWLALIAAREDTQTRACVLVDSGTALTVDIIRADGQHLGGYIAPGFTALRQSLGNSLTHLHQAIEQPASPRPGVTTGECLGNAVMAMGLGVIERALSLVADDNPQCYITGGDASVWLEHCVTGQARPDLVLEGLALYFQASV